MVISDENHLGELKMILNNRENRDLGHSYNERVSHRENQIIARLCSRPKTVSPKSIVIDVGSTSFCGSYHLEMEQHTRNKSKTC